MRKKQLRIKLPINNKVRGAIIIVAGITGGYACDKYFQNAYPIFTVVLPIMSVFIASYMINEIQENDEEEK